MLRFDKETSAFAVVSFWALALQPASCAGHSFVTCLHVSTGSMTTSFGWMATVDATYSAAFLLLIGCSRLYCLLQFVYLEEVLWRPVSQRVISAISG